MLHVLRHYLPLRKAVLIASETVLLTLVVMAGMSSHLWRVQDATKRDLAFEGLSETDALWRAFFSSVMVSVLTQITISFNELYDFRISSSRYDRASRFLGSAGSAILLVILSVALTDMWGVERLLDFPGLPLSQAVVILTSSLIIGFALLYLWRHFFHAAMRHTSFGERLLILGSGKLAQRMIDYLVSRPDSGYEIVGMVSGDARMDRRRGDRRARSDGDGTGNPWFEAAQGGDKKTSGDSPAPAPAAVAAAQAQVPQLGRVQVEHQGGVARLVLADPATEKSKVGSTAVAEPAPDPESGRESLFDLAVRLEVDDIIVALEERRGSLPTQDLLQCRLEGIVVEEGERFFERLTGKIPAEAMRPSYLIFNPGFVQHPMARTAKRTLDIVLALIGILLSWPLMLITAIMVRLDSPGPILFRQERTGRFGHSFTLMKFRSMRPDAEKETGPVWASEGDPRITRVGRFIRKTRLDELPQLFNVLGGSMSLVGPRPERPTFVEDLAEKIPYYHQRHIVKPGITGWAQINYPYGNTLEDALQKLQFDLFYIKYQSVLFDLSILFNTLKTVLLRKGT